MKITNISLNFPKVFKKQENIEEKKQISFEGDSKETALKVGALVTVPVALISTLTACNENIPNETNEETTTQTQEQNTSLDEEATSLGTKYDNINTNGIINLTADGKIILVNTDYHSLPISEFYLTNVKGQEKLHPNKDLTRNDEGTVIITISNTETPNDKESGITLNEIVEEVYSEALSQYGDEEERANIKNKMIDEIIQANPSLSSYINEEIGFAESYKKIGELNLYDGKSSNDEYLDTRLLTIPTTIVYQKQGIEAKDVDFTTSFTNYVPNSKIASVVKDSDDLLPNEYKSFSDMVYGVYGENISPEAYRDIVYAIVNSPANAYEFEYALDRMNFNEIIKTGNITDINRTLDENTNKLMFGLEMPNVTTLRVNSNDAYRNTAKNSAIIYQISPAALTEGKNDRVITLSDLTGDIKLSGDVFALKDVLQFYSSPDGNGRFAYIENGKTILNNDVNYVDEFANQIMKQVVYANIDLFATPYAIGDTVYEYGVFDVNEGFDTEGKSLDEIIKNSTINETRMNNFSFIDENGEMRYENGTQLNLPQFNYRLNLCETNFVVTPSTTEPTTEEPTTEEPTTEEPTCPEEPTTEEPTTEEPTTEEPTTEEPTTEEPTTEEPTTEEPTTEEPTTEEPTTEEPTTEEPTTEEPTTEEPTTEEPTTEEPTTEEPTTEEPTCPEEPTVEPSTEEVPTLPEPSTEEPTTEEPTTEEPTTEEPTTEEPTTEEPTTEEPTTEEPTTEKPTLPEIPTAGPVDPDEPTTEEPTTEEPTTEEPSCEFPPIEEPSSEEIPTLPEPSTEESTTEEPTTEEPTTEEPSTEEPSCEFPPIDEPSTEEIPTLPGPSTEESTTTEVTTEEPTTSEPPTIHEPSTEEPSTEETTSGEPPIEEPSTEEPTTEDTSCDFPPIDEPSTEEIPTLPGQNKEETTTEEITPEETTTSEPPTIHETTTEESTTEEITTSEPPTIHEPSTEESTTEEITTSAPPIQEPETEQPTCPSDTPNVEWEEEETPGLFYNQPKADQANIANSYEAPAYDEPKYDEPKYDEPKYEEPKYDEPKYEEPKYEAPAFDEPKQEAMAYHEPKTFLSKMISRKL